MDASPTPHKIHVRGLDNLTTNDIKDFSHEHFHSEIPNRVEWIDDSSANIVFDTPAIAMKALESFTLASAHGFSGSDLQLRTAKPLSAHPESIIQVRTAVKTDQKRPRAYEASRFYMMNPEHDPREKRRRNELHQNDEGYRKRRYGNQEHRRRRQKDHIEGFDASMYDDNGPSSRRDSLASSSAYSDEGNGHYRSRGDFHKPARRVRNGTLRDRSASPGRTPPPSYRARDPHPFPRENQGKELFPAKPALGGEAGSVGKELSSNKLLASKMKKELFPLKCNTITHRRSDAFDAADETASLFGSGLSITDTSSRNRPLVDRISNGTNSSTGRLKEPDLASSLSLKEDDDAGLNIRGMSNRQDQGFSIRGGAAAGTIKELFPNKQIGNAGKELFAEKLRGGRRNRAEDMFF
ncbi:hypothetical protein MMC21_000257 [Puttea exsequens]|nr:hypothetical protein [Puttea exsequens]